MTKGTIALFCILSVVCTVILQGLINQRRQINQQKQQVEQQQRQIDQLCSAAYMVLLSNKNGEFEDCALNKLEAGAYVVRFATFNNGTAVFERLACSETHKKYTLVYNVPAAISKKWSSDQVVSVLADGTVN